MLCHLETLILSILDKNLLIISQFSSLRLTSIESVMPSSHLILCRPLLLLPSIFPSIRVFSNDSVLHIRRPKYWSFNFSISPSNEYSRLISFRMALSDLLAAQEILKSLLQQHSSKASTLWSSAFFMGLHGFRMFCISAKKFQLALFEIIYWVCN